VSKNLQLLIIDPQNSFCKVVPAKDQQTQHDGELCVPGAWEDMIRVGQLVDRVGDMFNDIVVTLDSHNQLHIAHPLWFKHAKTGLPPAPFTVMREENDKIIGTILDAAGKPQDVGEYRTVREKLRPHTLNYLKALKAGGRFPHVIWPPHCLIGTPGHNIVEPLRNALLAWELRNVAYVTKVTKGSNMGCEHFSAVRAEVIDDNDPGTMLNSDLITSLMEADEIVLSGEARSHCLNNTVRDIANEFASQNDEFIKKTVLLTDGSTDVPGFETYGNDFVKEMTKRGMRTSTTADYLK
jgi:nicotinamidase-related amidase